MVEYVKKLAWNPELLKKYRYPALILALGLLLLLFPGGQKKAEQAEIRTEEAFDLAAFTREAEDMLSQLQGAGKVRLLLTLEDDGQREYLLNRSLSRTEGSVQREDQAVLTTRDGDQLPVTVTRTCPGFRGALVICEEAGPTLTLRIKEAISVLTGLGMDKITVLSSR